MRLFTPLFALLVLASPALADDIPPVTSVVGSTSTAAETGTVTQKAGNATVTVKEHGDVIIDEINGCKQGKSADIAKQMCSDYTFHGYKDKDMSIDAAYKSCLLYYETALRIQNTFCSYRIDAVFFEKTSASAGAAPTAGEQEKSEEVVSKDNERVYKITHAYIDRLLKLAPVYKKLYEDYLGKIGKMNGAGGTDELYEATCATSMVTGIVPGYARETLAASAHSNAYMTWQSMWTAIRTNVVALRQVKQEAEENAKLAQFRAVNVGDIFKTRIEQNGHDSENKKPDPSQLEGATAGAGQYIWAMSAKKYMPWLGEAYVAVIGGGVVLAYQIYTDKKIKVPETAATFITMLNPGVGAVATVTVAIARKLQQTLIDYRKFAAYEVWKNPDITAMQLVEAWGKSKNYPGCVKNAQDEAACIEKRKTMQMYEHNSCSKSPVLGNGAGPMPTPFLPGGSGITGPTGN